MKIHLIKERPTKFLFTPDCHFGWEKSHVGGKMITKPTHNLPAIKAVIEFAYDFKPDVWILGGDNINCGPITHWHQGKPRLGETFRLKQEFDAINSELLYKIDHIVSAGGKIWHRGNHEQWIDDLIDAKPGLEGLIEAEEYLQLIDRGWDIIDYGEVSSLGKLYFVHGDVCLRNGSSANPAKQLVTAYQRNIRCGHLHSYSAHTQQTAIDAKDYHTGVVVPSLSSRAPEYRKNAPSQFINGFLYGYVFPSGDFTDSVVIINKDKFIINGITYGGTKGKAA